MDGVRSRCRPSRRSEALIRDRALALGFDAVGFCRAELGARRAQPAGRLPRRRPARRHGLARTAHRARGNPRTLWPEARSVIALGLSYAPRRQIRSPRSRCADRGTISVYARNRDYHDVVKGMLKHLAQFIVARFGPDGEGVRRHRAGDGEAAGRARRHRLAGQAHQPGLAHARLVAVPGRDLHHARHRARRTAARSLRHLHALPRHLPDRCIPRTVPARCDALHLLSHHRTPRSRSRTNSAH